MNCSHKCEGCPAFGNNSHGGMGCKIMDEEISAIRAKRDAYKEMGEYFKTKR